MPFPMFGMGGGGANQEEDAGAAAGGAAGVGTGAAMGGGAGESGSFGGESMPPSPPSEPNTNEWGDPWLTDEQAGVSSPDDQGSFFDTLSDFFGDNDG